MKEKQFDLTVLGEALIDFTFYGKPEQGMALFEQNPGGAPANVVCAAAKLGLKTAFIGKVGCDMHGALLKRTLLNNNVNIEGVLETSKAFTTLAFVELSEDGERKFSFARKPGADTCLSIEEVNFENIKNSNILHIGSLSLTNEPARSATVSALLFARDNGVSVSYDPNYREMLWEDPNNAQKEIRSVLPYVNIIKISDEEMSLVTGFDNEREASKMLLNQGISCVLITLGAKGCYVRVVEGDAYVKGYKTEVVDTTGAGDAFVGGFLYQLIKNKTSLKDINLETAIKYSKFANEVASYCVGRRGAIPAMPTLKDLEGCFK